MFLLMIFDLLKINGKNTLLAVLFVMFKLKDLNTLLFPLFKDKKTK